MKIDDLYAKATSIQQAQLELKNEYHSRMAQLDDDLNKCMTEIDLLVDVPTEATAGSELVTYPLDSPYMAKFLDAMRMEILTNALTDCHDNKRAFYYLDMDGKHQLYTLTSREYTDNYLTKSKLLSYLFFDKSFYETELTNDLSKSIVAFVDYLYTKATKYTGKLPTGSVLSKEVPIGKYDHETMYYEVQKSADKFLESFSIKPQVEQLTDYNVNQYTVVVNMDDYRYLNPATYNIDKYYELIKTARDNPMYKIIPYKESDDEVSYLLYERKGVLHE